MWRPTECATRLPGIFNFGPTWRSACLGEETSFSSCREKKLVYRVLNRLSIEPYVTLVLAVKFLHFSHILFIYSVQFLK
jgi:hypothetical protein